MRTEGYVCVATLKTEGENRRIVFGRAKSNDDDAPFYPGENIANRLEPYRDEAEAERGCDSLAERPCFSNISIKRVVVRDLGSHEGEGIFILERYPFIFDTYERASTFRKGNKGYDRSRIAVVELVA